MTSSHNNNSNFQEIEPEVDTVTYALRVECQTDAFLIRAAVADWVYSWKETWATWDGKRTFPDMNVEFQLAWNPPRFTELQWIISCIPDCHVAAESFRPIQSYTGERTHYEKLNSTMKIPSIETIKKAKAGVEITLKWLPILKDGLLNPQRRFTAELGKPKAYLASEAKRFAYFYKFKSAQTGCDPVSEDTARKLGMQDAHTACEHRLQRS